MIDRVKRFLPNIDAEKFSEKGTAGIRSSVIDGNGKFVPDVILKNDSSSLHILNYNSPGATGALPFSAHIVSKLVSDGWIDNLQQDAQCGPWKFSEIIEKVS